MTGTTKPLISRRRVSESSLQSESAFVRSRLLIKATNHGKPLRCSMLGYGGTDKPIDSASYIGRRIAEDLIDIVNYENADNVIAVGHDWCVFQIIVLFFHLMRYKGFLRSLETGILPSGSIHRVCFLVRTVYASKRARFQLRRAVCANGGDVRLRCIRISEIHV